VRVEGDELQAASKEAGRPLSYLTGEETAELAEQVASPPEEYRAFLKQAYSSN
jgi:hypothetical protein